MQENSSKFPLILLVIVLILGGLALYWYLNLPKTASFSNPAVAAFDTSHNFDAAALKPYGDGIVVVTPYFQHGIDATHTDLGVSVWAKQVGKVVQIKEVSIEGVTLPSYSKNVLIAPTQVRQSTNLFHLDKILVEKIAIEDLIAAAEKSGGKLELLIKADIIENTPQRRVVSQTMKYSFSVHSKRVTPWSR